MKKQVDVLKYEETVRIMSNTHENKQDKKTTKLVNKWKIAQIWAKLIRLKTHC